MFKIFFAVLLAAISMNAMAEDTPLQFKVVSVVDKQSDKGITIVARDLKGGVFVLVKSGSTKYPQTTKLIQDLMVAKGIKVTDDPAAADVGIQFTNLFGLNFDDVETQTTNVDGRKVAAVILGGGLLSLMGSNTGNSGTTLFSAIEMENPSIGSSYKLVGKNERDCVTTLKYEANKKDADVATAALSAYISDFIKNHFVVDMPADMPSIHKP
ncbi:hypothetical protein GALL_26560 [mine drainage metagenome]|uniref:Uncharacterized protein n=1 Tax=mine drainage metagenome TaxID=410659 RepID=A0A1J5TSY4_9ZZZZ